MRLKKTKFVRICPSGWYDETVINYKFVRINTLSRLSAVAWLAKVTQLLPLEIFGGVYVWPVYVFPVGAPTPGH